MTDPVNDEEFENTVLVEDGFGTYWDKYGNSHEIKRFTWRNRNKIQVQVMNYGARITSIKMPDRKGIVEDIVLGKSIISDYNHNHTSCHIHNQSYRYWYHSLEIFRQLSNSRAYRKQR